MLQKCFLWTWQPLHSTTPRSRHSKKFVELVYDHFVRRNRELSHSNTIPSIDNNNKPSITNTIKTSIDKEASPSTDRPIEFGIRAYDLYGNKQFSWEARDEFGIYRGEHEKARATDGRVILVSKKNIRDFLERSTLEEYTYICLSEHAELLTIAKQDRISTIRMKSVRCSQASKELKNGKKKHSRRSLMKSIAHSTTTSTG